MSARRWTAPGYTDVRELRRDASGTVVLAEHDQSGSAVAVTYLTEELRRRTGFLEGVRREAELLGRVDSPQVVRLWEYVQEPEGVAIVTELVDGVSLRRVLDDRGPTTPEAALLMLEGALLGLRAAHACGVVHGDHRPEKVLVTAAGECVLTDVGITGRAGRSVLASGTPAYLAPERWTGAAATPQSDLYAATVSFVECLLGHPPYSAVEPVLARHQHENAPVPVDDVPRPVRRLVLRGMAKLPADRPADAAEFLAELDDAARAGYGDGWDERGRRSLAERTRRLALLFPRPAGTWATGRPERTRRR